MLEDLTHHLVKPGRQSSVPRSSRPVFSTIDPVARGGLITPPDFWKQDLRRGQASHTCPARWCRGFLVRQSSDPEGTKPPLGILQRVGVVVGTGYGLKAQAGKVLQTGVANCIVPADNAEILGNVFPGIDIGLSSVPYAEPVYALSIRKNFLYSLYDK